MLILGLDESDTKASIKGDLISPTISPFIPSTNNVELSAKTDPVTSPTNVPDAVIDPENDPV